jgi:hypothetical protein
MEFTKRDPFSGKTNTLDIPVTLEQLELWKSGVLIQVAMPNLSPNDQEFLITGIMPDSWDTAFKNRDEDEY